jgi:hypothetical protein
MINFLLNENIVTVIGVCGFFTTQLLGSLKMHVLDPASHHILPHEMFNHGEGFDDSKKLIRWKIFLKDLIMWTIMMYIIYLIWKKVLKRTEH